MCWPVLNFDQEMKIWPVAARPWTVEVCHPRRASYRPPCWPAVLACGLGPCQKSLGCCERWRNGEELGKAAAVSLR